MRRVLVAGMITVTAVVAAASAAAEPAAHRGSCDVTSPVRPASTAVPGLVDERGSSGPTELHPGDLLLGRGDLWVLRAAVVDVAPAFDVRTSAWTLKLAWVRAVPGALIIRARRLDGPGSFSASIPPVGAYPATGFLPTDLSFSTGGCWRVTGRLRSSTVVFSLRFSSSPAAICAQLEGQRRAIEAGAAVSGGTPLANSALANEVSAAITARRCAP